MFSDYFTVACRTGKGLTVFLVERSDNVDTKQIKTSYSTAAGTAYITFDNVVVPAENMLGKENKGMCVQSCLPTRILLLITRTALSSCPTCAPILLDLL